MKRTTLAKYLLATSLAFGTIGVSADAPDELDPAALAAMAEEYATLSAPYLGGALPDSADFSPPAPQPGDAVQARDDAASEDGLALMGTPRWLLASEDASLRKGALSRAFSCATGIRIDDAGTPALSRLMSRAATDLAFSTSDVKHLYQRPRPFMVNGKQTCTPEAEQVLRMDGSYPSGHSALGYGVSLILAELLPERAAQIVSRGREFGESRRICNVHWKSDVEEGRQIAAATVARLHSNADFMSDIAAAKAEIASGLPAPDASGCAAEQAALAMGR